MTKQDIHTVVSTATPNSLPRRRVLAMAAMTILAVGAASVPNSAEACIVIKKGCGTISISRSGSDVVVVVKNKSGGAAVGARVSVRMGRGAFDEKKTGKLGKTMHSIGVSSGDTVDVVVKIGGCTITKSDCVLP